MCYNTFIECKGVELILCSTKNLVYIALWTISQPFTALANMSCLRFISLIHFSYYVFVCLDVSLYETHQCMQTRSKSQLKYLLQ